MGTRGTFGFVIDSQEKISYNHSDSYPDGLGVDVLSWLREEVADIAGLRDRVRALRVVENQSTATPQDIENLREYADLSVSSRDPSEWYVLLRRTQGNPRLILEAGVIEDGSPYIGTEYGYLVDLDTETLRTFTSDRKPAVDWPFSELPTDDEFVSEIEAAGESA
jgi:hypothetical protein